MIFMVCLLQFFQVANIPMESGWSDYPTGFFVAQIAPAQLHPDANYLID